MWRHTMFECIQIGLQSFFRHSPLCKLFHQHVVVMDSLSSGRDLKSTEQKVKAECEFLILWIVHCIERTLL